MCKSVHQISNNSKLDISKYKNDYENAIDILTKYSNIIPFCNLIESLSSSIKLSSNNDIIDEGINYYCNNIYIKQKAIGNYNTTDFERLFKSLTRNGNIWKYKKIINLYNFINQEKVRLSLESFKILIKVCGNLNDLTVLEKISYSFINTYKICGRNKPLSNHLSKSDHCTIEILKSLSKLHPYNDTNRHTSYQDYDKIRNDLYDILITRIKERKLTGLFSKELLLDLAFGDREIVVTSNSVIIDENDVKWLINSAKLQENYHQCVDDYAFKSMQWLKRKIVNNKYFIRPTTDIHDTNNEKIGINDVHENIKLNFNIEEKFEQIELEKYRDKAEKAVYCLLKTWRENETFHNVNNIAATYSLAIHVMIGLRRSKAILKLILESETTRSHNKSLPRHIYVQAMRACSISHDWDGIVKLFTHMIDQQFSPTSQALTYVTDALIHSNEVTMAARILETSLFFDFEKSLSSFTKVIIGLVKLDRFDHAEEIYQLAIRCHGFDRISNDLYGGSLLLHRAIWLCHSKRFQDLEDHLIFCATRLDDETRIFNLFNHIVSRIANPGNEFDLEQAFHFAHLMLKINVEPSKTVLDGLLDNAIDSGRSIRAAALIDQLNKYRIQSDEIKMNNRHEVARRLRGIDGTKDNNEKMIAINNISKTTEWKPILDNQY